MPDADSIRGILDLQDVLWPRRDQKLECVVRLALTINCVIVTGVPHELPSPRLSLQASDLALPSSNCSRWTVAQVRRVTPFRSEIVPWLCPCDFSMRFCFPLV